MHLILKFFAISEIFSSISPNATTAYGFMISPSRFVSHVIWLYTPRRFVNSSNSFNYNQKLGRNVNSSSFSAYCSVSLSAGKTCTISLGNIL